VKKNEVAYFGYGSLVNRHTRPAHTRARPARLAGWIRQWKHCIDLPFGKACALTAEKRAGCEIEGVLVLDHHDGLAAVDDREAGYRRERIELPEMEAPAGEMDIFIYVSAPEWNHWGSAEYPILRSYVDCVLAGYLEVWGREGAAKFIKGTEGWGAPILDDRAAPRYPRAVPIDWGLRAAIDGLLEENGIRLRRDVIGE
jgi:glutathione-specific gamma-glutamylcyclotransferase